jgi:hypothetical protein
MPFSVPAPSLFACLLRRLPWTTRALFLCGIAATLAPPPAPCYVISEDNFVGEFLDSLVAPDEVVDTGSHASEQTLTLDHRDLGLSYFQDLGDMARFLPGVQANHFGLFGNRESVRLFSGHPNRTALLINGLPAGYADYLGVDALSLPVHSIQRIEVTPLAGLLPDGAPGSGGAVNIVTRGFSPQLPFYQFTSLTEESFQEQLGHLHFAQRLYRNLNFYMSSLIKKNTNEDIGYSAVQYSIKFDAYLRNNWNATVSSWSHSDDRTKNVQTMLDGAVVDDGSQAPHNQWKLFSAALEGRPYQQNRTRFSLYRSADKRTYTGNFQWAQWSDWGFNLRQELGGLVENQGLEAGLTYRAGSYATTILETTSTHQQDTLSHTSRTNEFTLRLKDTTEVLGLFDFTAALNLSKFSSADNLQLLPASGIYYRKIPNTSFYLLAEKTFRPPTAQEGSRRQLPLATVFYSFLTDDSLAAVASRHAPLPEKGTAFCLGGTYGRGRTVETHAGFLYRELTDAIYWDWPDSFQTGDKVHLNNRTEIYRGLFALARFRAFREQVNGSFSYTHLLNNTVPGAGMVPALPDDHVAGYLQGKLTIKKEQLMDIGLVLAGEYTGQQKRCSWNNTSGPLPAETVLDMTLFYNYLYIKTYLTFKNVLNRQPETTDQKTMRTFFGYPARPMNYQFGVSLELGGIYDQDQDQE